MACNQALAGITKDCVANRGGIKSVWIGLWGDFSWTVTNGAISAGTLRTGGAKMKQYFFARRTASYKATPLFNSLGEFAGEQNVLAMTFGKMDTAKRVEITALSYNELVVVFEDMNGSLWLMGYDNPVVRTGGETNTGTELADVNGYYIELSDNSLQLAYNVPASVWTSSLHD